MLQLTTFPKIPQAQAGFLARMAPAHALDAELRGESCNRRAKRSREDVGIWHETYLVPAGCYEAIYSGMPPTGLCRVGTLVPATGTRETARQRSGRAAQV